MWRDKAASRRERARSSVWAAHRWQIRTVVGVHSLELAILKHGLQRARVEELCLFDDAINHVLTGLLELRLDEAHHGNVALDLGLLAQIETGRGDAQALHAEFALLRRLDARLVATNAVLVAQIDAHWGIDVGLQAPRHVVETTIEGNLAGAKLADTRNHLDSLRDFVPGAVVFVGAGIAWGGDGLVAEDERIQCNYLAVRV